VVSGRDPQKLEQTIGRLEGAGHLARPFDLENAENLPKWMKEVASTAGPFDGVVHSAGIHGVTPLRFVGLPAIEEMLRINCGSAAMVARGFRQKGVRAAGPGSLVFITSAAGLVGEAGVSAYSASKAALIGLTRSLAMELAPESVRVNAVAPGVVESEMSARIWQTLTAEQVEAIRHRHPIGTGNVRDVANSIAFLLADTARWITGSVLVVDGGYTAH